MMAGVIRAWLTTSTPGVVRSSSARSGLSPTELSQPPVSTMCVPVKSVSSEPASDVLADAANTVMKPTSATPIISDAAVRAVRFGLRIALRVASSPATPAGPQRQAEHLGDRPGEHRAEHGDADEHRQRAEPDQRELALRGPPTRAAIPPTVTTVPDDGALGRGRRAVDVDLAQRRDRCDPGGPASRQPGRQHRDADTDRERQDHRLRR